MRLIKLTTDAEGLPNSIHFQPSDSSALSSWRDSKVNWVTIILGENGVRKSLLLRLLAGAALGRNRFKSPGHQVAHSEIDIEGLENEPLVVAISGTPNDRFPISAGIPMQRRPTSFDVDNFAYYGPKQDGNGHTISRQLATFIHSILSDVDHAFQRRHSLSKILEYVGLSPSLQITLIPTALAAGHRSQEESETLSARMDSLKLRASNLENWLSFNSSTQGSSLNRYVSLLLSNHNILNSSTELSIQSHRFLFDFSSHSRDGFGGPEPSRISQELANLIAIGYLRVANIRLKPLNATTTESHPDGNSISSTDLSSGQWHLLTSLLSLSMKVRSNSLILIDEPENSLHPTWQRDYIKLLFAALAGTIGSHVVIATHSPLVAAGVPTGNGSLLSAVKKADTRQVQLQDVGAVYAWRPDDVLREKFQMESPRAPELEQLADRLLSIVSGTAYPPEQDGERIKLALRLQDLASGLPMDDPIGAALRSLIGLALRGNPEGAHQ